MDLQEQWESDPSAFDWSPLQALARDGAQAYNEGSGPSFHSLALDGVQHSEFHERFLAWVLQAGFDPFKLAQAGSGNARIPVIDHAGLADAASANQSSARMQASLMEAARARFEPLAGEIQAGRPLSSDIGLLQQIEASAESIPHDLLEKLAPELARSHQAKSKVRTADPVNPVEGYLSSAEVIIDNSKPYG
jgi:hypothetical protein